MQKRAFIVASIILLSMLHSITPAQSPSITSGIVWLTSAQTVTGYWPEVNTSEYYSTATVLDAVYLLDPTNSSYASGFSWITNQVVSPTDYLSRRIIALKRVGAHAFAELEMLLLYRNTDGGWGGESTYLSDIIDTALTLHALKASNYTDSTLLYQAINFLTTNQHSDGGWGFTTNDPSNAYVTAIVLRALSGYSSQFSVQSSIQSASAYLLTKHSTRRRFWLQPVHCIRNGFIHHVPDRIREGDCTSPAERHHLSHHHPAP